MRGICSQVARRSASRRAAVRGPRAATAAVGDPARDGALVVHQHLAVDDASSGRRCRARHRPASSRDRARRQVRADRDRRRSGRRVLPASSEPISASSPSVRAPPRVAIHSTSRAGSAPGPRRIACSTAASRISSNMSSRLLQAAPSAPSDTVMPRGAHLDDRRDARAELQVRAGAVHHLDVVLGEQSPARASSTQTQCAAHRRGDARPAGRQVLDVVAGRSVCLDDARSRRATPTRGCARARRRCADSAATASSSSREHDTAKRGANAARRRPSCGAVPARADSASALVDRRVASSSCSRAGTCGVDVHHALADRRAQAARGDRFEHHIGVVHRLHRQHGGGAARAAAR